MRSPAVVAITVWLAIAAVIGASAAPALGAGSLTVTTCGANIFSHHAVFGINTSIYCPPGTNIPPGMTIAPGPNTVSAGTRASWEADAPAGLTITGASIAPNQMYSIHINDGQSWGGGFYWAGGGAGTYDSTNQFSVSGLNSSYFGFQIVCGWSTCNGNTHPAQFTVESINLYATETQGPWLAAPSGLWQASGRPSAGSGTTGRSRSPERLPQASGPRPTGSLFAGWRSASASPAAVPVAAATPA